MTHSTSVVYDHETEDLAATCSCGWSQAIGSHVEALRPIHAHLMEARQTA